MGRVRAGWKNASDAFGGGGLGFSVSQRCCEWDGSRSWEGLWKSQHRCQPLTPLVAASLHPPYQRSWWSSPQIRARLEFVTDFAMMFSSCSSSEQNQMFKRSVNCGRLSAHSFKPGTTIQSEILRGFPFYLLRRGNGRPLIRPFLLNVGILALSPVTCSYLATGSLN